MIIVDKKITKKELMEMSEKMFGGLVKAVVDIHQKIMAVDAPMHADQEALLIEKGLKIGGKMKYHHDLTSERWQKFNLFEQMANIGSEVFRAQSWRNRDPRLSKLAFERALELFDLTISDPKNIKQLKEICRTREVLVDYFIGKNEYKSSKESWQNYFYAFNYAARL